jgi:hypothetical protein
MTTEQKEQSRRIAHKLREFTKRHHEAIMIGLQARPMIYEALRRDFEEYRKKVLLEQALDYVSK